MRNFILLVLALTCSYLSSAQHSKDTIYTKADQMPYFIGCEAFDNQPTAKRNCSNNELVNFISRYLVYPEEAQKQGIEGTIYVSFIIEKDGLLGELSLLNDIGGGCGKAALIVIEEMPRWEPGKIKGQAVRVRMNLPIQFFLKSESNDGAEKYNLTWGDLQGREVTKNQLAKNLYNKIYVRSPDGSERYVDKIEFTYTKDSKVWSTASRGGTPPGLKKIIDKSKAGGTLSISASVQDNGQFMTVSRSFLITK